MAARALYGGWPATDGQRTPLAGAEVLVASKLPLKPPRLLHHPSRDLYPLRPWLRHHGIAEDAARRVICTLELLRPDQWLNASVELLVRVDTERQSEPGPPMDGPGGEPELYCKPKKGRGARS